MASLTLKLDQNVTMPAREFSLSDPDPITGQPFRLALPSSVMGDMPGVDPALKWRFLDILHQQTLQAVFQPIVNGVEQNIYGYEALIRGPQGSDLESPLILFRLARELGVNVEFEILCRRVSIRAFAELGLDSRLFLNVSPFALLDPGFRTGRTLQYLREYEIAPDRVVMEMTEYEQVGSFDAFRMAVQYYRSLGFQIALDDLGSGYSGLRLWAELMPDFIKVDKHFIRDIHQDSIKSNFVNALVSMAAATRCQVIAEGVEQPAERDALKRLQVSLMQGYLFAAPMAEPAQEIDSRCFPHTEDSIERCFNDSVLRISHSMNPIGPDTRVERVLSLFQQSPGLHSLPIVDENRHPVGLVDRYRFLNRLMESQYGLALYSRQPISRFVDETVMQVDLDTDLAEVSQRVTALSSMHQAFIVTDQGRYYGVATIRDLLEIITEQRLQYAQHANPLTLLPGVVPTNEVIDRLLRNTTSFHVAYVDLDSFKPYNDAYGYEAGDAVIKWLAEMLVDTFGCETGCVGHIGGDDFLVVSTLTDFSSACDSLVQRFDRGVHHFYREEHLREGGLSGHDRQGKPTFHSLLSLSLGVVPSDLTGHCRSHIDIADLASEAKKYAKSLSGSGYFISVRTPLRSRAS